MARSVAQQPEEEGAEKPSTATLAARVAGKKQWQNDLAVLLAQAENRFGDVAWRSKDGETTWAHKAIVYARSTGPFQSRYLGAGHLGTDSHSLLNLSLAPSTPNLLSPIPRGLGITEGRSPSPGASSIASYSPSLGNGSPQRPVLTLPPTDHALLRPALEVMYTAKGMSDVFAFLFDENQGKGDWSEQVAAAKLRDDLLFMWRSKLYADVQIQIIPDDAATALAVPTGEGHPDEEEEAVYFTAHRAILASRCPYFANQLLSVYTDTTSRLLTLPASAFSPAALHFLLGSLYCGSLDFSLRVYDLTTGCDILRGAQYLELEHVQAEVEARLADMCHAFAGCCARCARRCARLLRITSQGVDFGVAGARLARAARPVVVKLWSDAWAYRDVGDLEDDKLRASLAKESAATVATDNAVSALGATLSLRGKLATSRGIWVDRTLDMLLVVEARVRKVVAANLTAVVASAGFVQLLEGHFFSLSREVLSKLLDDLVADLDDATAANAYQVITGAVLLREDGLPMDARVLVEEARQGVVRYLRRKWISIRANEGFEPLDNWALKEIADELEMPADDLLNHTSKATGPKSKTGLRASVGRASARTVTGERGPEAVDGTLRSSVLNRNAARASMASSSPSSRPSTAVRTSIASSTISTPTRTSSNASSTTPSLPRSAASVSASRRAVSSPAPPRLGATTPTQPKDVASPHAPTSSPPAPTRAPPKPPVEVSPSPKPLATLSPAPKAASVASVRTTASTVARRTAATPLAPNATPIRPSAPAKAASVSSVRSRATATSVARKPAVPATVSPMTSPSVGPASPPTASRPSLANKAASVSSVRTTRSTATATSRAPPTPRTPTTPAPRAPSVTSVRTTATTRSSAKVATDSAAAQRRAQLRATASSASLGTKGKVKPAAAVSPGAATSRSTPVDEPVVPALPGTALRVPLPALVSFDNGAKAKAAVHFIGRTHFGNGSYVGVCVDEAGLTPTAKAGAGVEWGDGKWEGKAYFAAAPGRCCFVRPQAVVFLF